MHIFPFLSNSGPVRTVSKDIQLQIVGLSRTHGNVDWGKDVLLLEQNCTYAALPTAFNSFVSWQNFILGIVTNHIGMDGWIWKTNLGDLHFSLKYWFIWMRLNLKINIHIKRLCRQIKQVMRLILSSDLDISLMSNSHNWITINGNTTDLCF